MKYDEQLEQLSGEAAQRDAEYVRHFDESKAGARSDTVCYFVDEVKRETLGSTRSNARKIQGTEGNRL